MTLKTQAKVIEVKMCNVCKTIVTKCPKCLDYLFEDDEMYCVRKSVNRYEHTHCSCMFDEGFKDNACKKN